MLMVIFLKIVHYEEIVHFPKIAITRIVRESPIVQISRSFNPIAMQISISKMLTVK